MPYVFGPFVQVMCLAPTVLQPRTPALPVGLAVFVFQVTWPSSESIMQPCGWSAHDPDVYVIYPRASFFLASAKQDAIELVAGPLLPQSTRVHCGADPDIWASDPHVRCRFPPVSSCPARQVYFTVTPIWIDVGSKGEVFSKTSYASWDLRPSLRPVQSWDTL